MSGRCRECGRRLGARAELLYHHVTQGAVYLCGRAHCTDSYNGTPPASAPGQAQEAA